MGRVGGGGTRGRGEKERPPPGMFIYYIVIRDFVIFYLLPVVFSFFGFFVFFFHEYVRMRRVRTVRKHCIYCIALVLVVYS